MSKNEEFFTTYCGVACDLLKRDDRDSPAIKSIIRFVVREASNCCSELPGYDNKLGAEIVSESAIKQISQSNTSGLIGDHVVPVSIINKAILQLSNKSIEEIQNTVKRLSKRAVITVEENKRLKENGLAQKMPKGWELEGSNIMARYEAVAIETTNISYKDALRNA